jgi:LytS/YehU family sensor histidine kinase
LRYAYRLSGFEQRWTNTANRQHGSYTNIPPGKYVLELRSGGIGYWNPVGLRLPIRIVPPFWQTTWFIVLMTLLALSTAWAAYQLRMRQVRHKAELQRKFEAQLARVEMAALRAQMNPHFVFNCLSSINRYILVNQAEAASSYLNKFAKLIRLILDNSKTEFVPLDKEIEALKLYVDMEKMRFDDKFQFEIFVEPGLQPEHLEIPPLLIQPFVENAIWHGLMHKKALGTLQVRITQGAQGLCIEIEDDGIGRAKAAELKSRSAQEHKSHGTQLSADRIANINALFGSKASITIIDLHNPEGHPAGTLVRLLI